MMIGWTTTQKREDAERLARGLVESGFAACAQVSGPVLSIYRWQGAVESTEEFRLTVKFATVHRTAVARWLTENHPYTTPQWVACQIDEAMEKYLKWVVDDPT